MPRSQQPKEGEQIMVERILSNPNARVLDVGAGDGKWGELLRGKVRRLDGVEVWEPYITDYRLDEKYDDVFPLDIRDFEGSYYTRSPNTPYFKDYDVVILGDVLEHLPQEDAVKLVKKLQASVKQVFLTIPISFCPQEAVNDNPFEAHKHQWTHEEVEALGFKQLHQGFNENGLVLIGTYEWQD